MTEACCAVQSVAISEWRALGCQIGTVFRLLKRLTLDGPEELLRDLDGFR